MNSTTPNDPDKDMRMVESHVTALSEHFDSVQILCSRLSATGGTRTIAKGSGNYLARYGQVREWLIREDERARFNLRQEMEE